MNPVRNKFAGFVIQKSNSFMKSFFAFIAAGILLLSAPAAFGQSKQKLGHIDSDSLLQMMPERAAAEKAIEDRAKELQATLQAMGSEYETKLTDYQTNAATMSDLIRQTKEKELLDIQTRIQNFQQSADEDLQETRIKELEPVLEKARQAIKDVANENGYTYVFDSSVGVVLHYPDGDDILPLVKKKLGL